MGERPITDTGWRMLDMLPWALQDSVDYQAVLHAASREVDRMEAALGTVTAQFSPASADILLGAWEAQVRLPVGGFGTSLAQREARVLYRVRKILGANEGREWERNVTDLVGEGWTYQEHIPGDATTPPVDTLRISLPFPPGASAYANALVQIREFTPAHLEIEFQSLGGFMLDESQLDVEELTY
jgi:hypothetical protein